MEGLTFSAGAASTTIQKPKPKWVECLEEAEKCLNPGGGRYDINAADRWMELARLYYQD